MTQRPLIVGLGGTTRPHSTSETALRACLREAERLGARTQLFGAEALDLPMYGSAASATDAKAKRLVNALREADGLVLSTPAYHGSLSGLLKNALDYAEELRSDERPYLDMRAVGIVVCAFGPQAIGTTLVTIRSIVHALRGWPTPLGVGVNTSAATFDDKGVSSAPEVNAQLAMLARQVTDFAFMAAHMRPQPAAAAQ